MGQIHGSGLGNWNNAASVDSSEGPQQGRLLVSSSGTSTQLYDGVTGPAILDNMTLAIGTIETDHSEIHEEHSFVSTGMQTIGNTGSFALKITTPDTINWAHLIISAKADNGEANYMLYEDVTATAVTVSGIYNRNRNSNITATVVVSGNATITDTGTMIYQEHFGLRKAGGEARGASEIILKSGTEYGLILNNDTASNNDISWILNWYEHVSMG